VDDGGLAGSTILSVALSYRDRGWVVVPQLPGAKQPCVKWKEFQERVPTEEELTRWFTRWPSAGLALVLGPVSGVFVLDVDGPEAHAALVARLGSEPVAPKALSGSRKPCRYHLFFRHPDLLTADRGHLALCLQGAASACEARGRVPPATETAASSRSILTRPGRRHGRRAGTA
jgi:hypothetical protein